MRVRDIELCFGFLYPIWMLWLHLAPYLSNCFQCVIITVTPVVVLVVVSHDKISIPAEGVFLCGSSNFHSLFSCHSFSWKRNSSRGFHSSIMLLFLFNTLLCNLLSMEPSTSLNTHKNEWFKVTE